MNVNDQLYKFLKELNRTIVVDGELGSFKVDMGSSNMGTNTYLHMCNYTTHDKFVVRQNVIEWQSLQWDDFDDNPEYYAVRIQDEELNFQQSTILDVITIDTEEELRLALHNLCTFIRDSLNLYDDVLWRKPYSDFEK